MSLRKELGELTSFRSRQMNHAWAEGVIDRADMVDWAILRNRTKPGPWRRWVVLPHRGFVILKLVRIPALPSQVVEYDADHINAMIEVNQISLPLVNRWLDHNKQWRLHSGRVEHRIKSPASVRIEHLQTQVETLISIIRELETAGGQVCFRLSNFTTSNIPQIQNWKAVVSSYNLQEFE